MENSINFNHNTNEILTSNDKKLYRKSGANWILINSILFRGYDMIPSNDVGVSGDYFLTFKKYQKSYILDKLYYKTDIWSTIGKTIHFVDELDDDLGNEGDLACITSIISLEPAILVGNGSYTSVFHRETGTLRYDDKENLWYVQTNIDVDKTLPQGSFNRRREYALKYKNQRPDYHGAAMAMILNQHIYQTYTKNNTSHRYGFNSGGNYFRMQRRP